MSILLHGDCLEELKNVDDNSVDLIFCDLPYGQTNCKWDCKIDLELLWIEVMRVKKLNTPLFFTTTTKFGVNLIRSSPKNCPFRYDLVWVKTALAGFLSAKKMPMRKHEMIYVFYEKLPFYDLSSHEHISVVKEEKIIKDTKYGTNTYDTEKRNKPILRLCDQQKYDPPLPNSLLEIKSTRGNHSTEKPVALIEWILKYYSKENDVVLDPTMGSGTTGVACKNMNRNFIGIEKNPEFYDFAVNRIE